LNVKLLGFCFGRQRHLGCLKGLVTSPFKFDEVKTKLALDTLLIKWALLEWPNSHVVITKVRMLAILKHAITYLDIIQFFL
jgi:hypothetical protein